MEHLGEPGMGGGSGFPQVRILLGLFDGEGVPGGSPGCRVMQGEQGFPRLQHPGTPDPLWMVSDQPRGGVLPLRREIPTTHPFWVGAVRATLTLDSQCLK